MSTPLISFIIPFYGSAALLKRALDSLVAQTDGDFEAIIVDDCSPESGEQTCSSYDTRFRYVKQARNCGPYQGRVRGIEEARGEYVVDIDCDDYVKKELVANLRVATRRGDADIIIYRVEQDEGGRIVPHWCEYEPGVYTAKEVIERFISKRLQWNFWSKAIRRELIQKTWEIEPRLRSTRVMAPDDYCAVVPLVLSANKVEVIEYVGHRYWQNPNSICHGVSFSKIKKAFLDTLEARRIILSYAEKIGADSEIKRQIHKIALMIINWWCGEWRMTVKREIKRLLFFSA